jgi:hypothetical protein
LQQNINQKRSTEFYIQVEECLILNVQKSMAQRKYL